MHVGLLELLYPGKILGTVGQKPLWSRYLAASLRLAGYRTIILSTNGDVFSETNTLFTTQLKECDLLGLSISDPLAVEPVCCAIRALRQRGFKGMICVGGQTATLNCAYVLGVCPEIDCIVMSEGEVTLCELVNRLERNEDWRKIKGLAFRDGSSIVVNPRRKPPDISKIPWPSRDDQEIERDQHSVPVTVPILSGRGCKYNCRFCSVGSFFAFNGQQRWRRRPVHDVVEEITYLVKYYKVTDFLFVDDLFLAQDEKSVAWANEFARTVICLETGITFTISATVDSIREDVIEILKKAGLRRVFIGAESASPDILKYLGKWFTRRQVFEAHETSRRLKIPVSVSFMNFTPATEMFHLKENVSFFRRFSSSIIPGLLNKYQPYSGTPLYSQLKKEGRLGGQFPNEQYLGVDSRVEMVYKICRKCFGPLLELHREIARVGSIRLSNLSEARPSQDEWPVRKYQWLAEDNSFSEMVVRINQVVADLFEEVLAFVAMKGCSRDPMDTEQFVHQHSARTCEEVDTWAKVLKSYEVMYTSCGRSEKARSYT